jgi:5-formyltetrahydrofolate cyclo-ligase
MSLTPELRSWRKLRREALLAQRLAVGREQHDLWNAQITSQLLAALKPAPGTVIACYWPFKGEFDPRFLMRAWRQAGARTALPVVVQKAAPLQFHDGWPGMPTSSGPYGLPAPEGGDTVTPHVALIPPIGFDDLGFRLGYGGGYYDRTLAALAPQPLKIGVAFEMARIATIEPQHHDIAMDFIATEDAWYQVTVDGLLRIDPTIASARLALALASASR